MKRLKLLAIVVFGIFMFIGLNMYELYQLTWCQQSIISVQPAQKDFSPQISNYSQSVAWVRGQIDSGHLNHVVSVFRRLGYEITTAGQPLHWDVLWSHEYPFQTMVSELRHMAPHQRVNHFPGSGFVTNKVNLVTSGLPFIPKSFEMPYEKEKLQKFALANPAALFVQKLNDHRGIQVQSLDDLDLTAHDSFVQVFMHDPLLIDGKKFDIGIYTILTSIQPLRVYVYDGDVLFRFCPDDYYPFDANIQDKYVIGDDYLPIWKVPSLAKYYSKLGFGMRDSFNAWLKSHGKDPSVLWQKVQEAIGAVFYNQEAAMIETGLKYFSEQHRPMQRFFEMMRFDFVVDSNLGVHLMEANMSPNLSSEHMTENKLLYEQILFNTLWLVGLGQPVIGRKDWKINGIVKEQLEEKRDSARMRAAEKDLVVFAEHCTHSCMSDAHDSCLNTECHLCLPCLSGWQKDLLRKSYLEHINRGSCRRILPPPIVEGAHNPSNISGLTVENVWMSEWFRGKCVANNVFCS